MSLDRAFVLKTIYVVKGTCPYCGTENEVVVGITRDGRIDHESDTDVEGCEHYNRVLMNESRVHKPRIEFTKHTA